MIKKSFTLAELTIVIIIIAILAALAIPQFVKVQERAKVSAAMSKLDMIRKAESIYHSLYDNYTTDISKLSEEVPEVAKVNDADWNFSISCTNCSSDFTATATRKRGRYKDKTITINETGQIGGSHPLIPNK